jgi:hypothetical protein
VVGARGRGTYGAQMETVKSHRRGPPYGPTLMAEGVVHRAQETLMQEGGVRIS